MGDDSDDVHVPYALTIERVDNGFVTIEHGAVKDVFEEPEDTALNPDPKTMARVLWAIIEYFGALGTKYDKERVRVTVEPGIDKVEN
jgi:hypothetical protein